MEKNNTGIQAEINRKVGSETWLKAEEAGKKQKPFFSFVRKRAITTTVSGENRVAKELA